MYARCPKIVKGIAFVIRKVSIERERNRCTEFLGWICRGRLSIRLIKHYKIYYKCISIEKGVIVPFCRKRQLSIYVLTIEKR